jgi:hypothetical protein
MHRQGKAADRKNGGLHCNTVKSRFSNNIFLWTGSEPHKYRSFNYRRLTEAVVAFGFACGQRPRSQVLLPFALFFFEDPEKKGKRQISKGKSGYRNPPFGCGSAALRYFRGFQKWEGRKGPP